MQKVDKSDEYSQEEAQRRRDEALRRALNTPPKPHKATQKAPDPKTCIASQKQHKH